MADSFLNLQNGFYNALCQGLGLSQNSFQLLQPSPPLVPGNDSALWSYFNNIPPYSLTQNYIVSAGNQFFSDYKGLISALKAPPNTFQQDIGTSVYNAWISYVSGLSVAPAATSLPDMFFNWASIHYPDVADVGSADLSAMLLDPISSAGMALMPYSGHTARPPDWTLGYPALMQQLETGPQVTFQVTSSQMNTNVSSSWTSGSNSGFGGLWGGSSSTSQWSQQFASSSISVNASFAHVITFGPSPGNWYSSAAMGDAYSHKSGAPWNSQSPIGWTNTFDPQNGNMPRFMGSLIVVDTMSLTVNSDAVYSSADQSTIESNSSAGLWPFYTTSSSSYATTTETFDQQGHMTVKINTAKGVPVVIGGYVIPVDKFVGHAILGMRIHEQLVGASQQGASAMGG